MKKINLTLQIEDKEPVTFECNKFNIYSGYLEFRISGESRIRGIPMHKMSTWSYEYILEE